MPHRVLITNRKTHTGFLFVPTSMTLNDLERRSSTYFAFFSPNSIVLQAYYVTVVEDKPILSVKYCLPVPVFHFWPKLTHTLQRRLSAIAEHLVIITVMAPILRVHCSEVCTGLCILMNVLLLFAGRPGTDGLQGAVGEPGDRGAAGRPGDTGAPGQAGPPGVTAQRGARGDTGPQGPQGVVGNTGSQGAIGPRGARGDTGASGNIGAAGSPGQAGQAGFVGVPGPPGAIGAPGIRGDTGAPGIAGAPGLPGNVGPIGSPGMMFFTY